MITKNDILLKLKELKPTLHKDFAVKEIGLIGSFSDETYSDDSDIDLLVELEKPIGCIDLKRLYERLNCNSQANFS